MEELGPPARHWIGGDWIAPGKHETSINPATYECIGIYADADVETAKAGIAAAVRAFRETRWARDRHLRAKVLHQMAEV